MAAPDVFEEIFARLTPERLLRDPRATGEGVVVAILDSGVERQVIEDRYQLKNQPIHRIEGAVFRAGSPEPLPYDGRQSSSHGTIVACRSTN